MDSTRRCSVPDCDRKRFGNGYCNTHYYRIRRNGTLELKPRTRAVPPKAPAKRARTTCGVDGCETLEDGLCGMCKMHDTRRRRHGDPLVCITPAQRRMPHGEDSPRWAGEAITYSGLHIRLKRVRGSARTHACECGAPARQWAYQHGDPQERTEELSPGSFAPYSPNLDAYVPMCTPCHKKYDMRRFRT